eukprot:5532305-Prymnesium_polylepis.1
MLFQPGPAAVAGETAAATRYRAAKAAECLPAPQRRAVRVVPCGPAAQSDAASTQRRAQLVGLNVLRFVCGH